MTYENFINHVLYDDPDCKEVPARFKMCMEYLTNYDNDTIPRFDCDLNIISFSNGVVELSSTPLRFTHYATMPQPMQQRVARHHIPMPYTGNDSTPLLDTILLAQFDTDVGDLQCALLGRTFFKVGQLDGWQVMSYIVGLSGTSKSLILNILRSLFAAMSVGNLRPSARRSLASTTWPTRSS